MKNEDTLIVVDEVHNVIGYCKLCTWISELSKVLVMSATLLEEVHKELQIEHTSKASFLKGIEDGYVVDYTIWLPVLTRHDDGLTSIDANVPTEFCHLNQSLAVKMLYHITCMLRTQSRHTIVYLQSQDECDYYIVCFCQLLEEYHGIDNYWFGKITSDVDGHQRRSLLKEFQYGNKGGFRILTSVRILDEAVDVPKCDSVFITSVGKRSSDIRFFQCVQRSGTPDPQNPHKRNHVFLLAEGWESCTQAFAYLRECDPYFT